MLKEKLLEERIKNFEERIKYLESRFESSQFIIHELTEAVNRLEGKEHSNDQMQKIIECLDKRKPEPEKIVVNVEVNDFKPEPKPEPKPTVTRTESAKIWIRENPPQDKEKTSMYYARYNAWAGDKSLATSGLSKVVKEMGYITGGGGTGSFWTSAVKEPDDESGDDILGSFCVYFIAEVPFSGKVKMGKTNNLSRRLGTLQTGSATHLDVIKSIAVESREEMNNLESSLHKTYVGRRLHGEWFEMELGEVFQICLEHGKK